MRCSRRNCSNCCATGGGRRGRGPGCFQARTPSIRCRLASSDASSMRRRRRRESPSACRRTLCGIASPPICSNRTSTSALSRFCSGTPSSRRQRSIPASPSTRSATLPAPWTGSAWTWRGDPRPPDGGRMGRPPGHSPGVADIFRTHGSAWCRANAGHVSLGQLKVMSAIETCRTAALGGHVERCKDCAHVEIAYNSCRNRHCPKCQGAAARQWLEAQRDDLLPVAYYHLVFTLPAPIAPIAFPEQDRRLRPAVQGRRRDADRHCGQPKTLGSSRWLHRRAAHLGLGSHSPPAPAHDCARRRPVVGRFALDRLQAPLLPARLALSRLFRRLFLEGLAALHQAGRLAFFGDLVPLADRRPLTAALAPLRRTEW